MKFSDYHVDTSLWGWTKAFFAVIAMVLGMAIDYIGVERALVYTLTGLMVIDWGTGILKSRKLKIPITSKRSHKGLVEKFALMIIPISIGITLKVIGIPIGITIKATFSLFCVMELYSLIGNCYCVYTGEPEKEYDATSALIKWIRRLILNVFKAAEKKDDKSAS